MTTQRGFALLELVIAAALTLMLTVWATQALLNRIQDATAQSAANWMLAVRHGVQSYLEQHGNSLRQAGAPADLLVHGYQNWAAPQIAELKKDGQLTAGFPEQMRPVGAVRILILRDGVCPGDECKLTALLHSERAFMKTAEVVDEQMLAQWLLEARGLGGAVHPMQPETIRGHTFQYPNPLQGQLPLAPGTVAMVVSNEELRGAAYLRVRDERDPQFQSNATVSGDITAGGIVSAGKYLHLASSSEWQTPCLSSGAVTRDHTHGLLVCTRGLWEAASRSPGGFALNSIYGCSTPEGRPLVNPVTRACSCPPEHFAIQISEGESKDISRGIMRGYLCVK